MRDIPLEELGLENEKEIDAAAVANKRVSQAGWSNLSHLLGRWEQWVRELDSDYLMTREEFLGLLWTRDEVEEAIGFLPAEIVKKVALFVDVIDKQFRSVTVSANYFQERQSNPAYWWWGRVPFSTEKRQYMLQD